MASLEARTLPQAADDCRRCRYARWALRSAVYVAVGMAVALTVSWVVARVPLVGWVLAAFSTLLLVRTLLRLFFRPSPAKALMHLGVSLALGLLISGLLGLLLR